MTIVRTVEELETIYGTPAETSLVKEVPQITPHYRAFIEAAPFVTLATSGPEGLDCSPRGDLPGFVRIQDEKTLLLPDRAGNNRIDSLRNIVRDPRVGLLFMIPGVSTTIRANGHAELSTAPELLASFAVKGKPPRSVLVFTIEALYFQCSRAIIRSNLWNSDAQIDPANLPTIGTILANLSDNRVGGETYDAEWPEKANRTLW